MTIRRTDARAFMLWELMMALGLLAVIALLAGQIFLALNRTSVEVAKQHTAQSAFDQATRELRGDVFIATQIRLQDSRLVLQTADGQKIDWQADESLKRTSGKDVRKWKDLGAHLTFAVNGPTVILRQEPIASDSGGELVLPSQALLLKGEKR